MNGGGVAVSGHVVIIAFMQNPAKPDFLQPIAKKRLQADFPSGFAIDTEMAVDDFLRLASAGIALRGPLRVTGQFNGRDRLAIQLTGEATVACARCLAPAGQQISADCRFRLFETEAQADRAVSALDPEEPVCDADGQSLVDLIEDEVLMQMAEPVLHTDCAIPSGAAPMAGALPGAAASPRADGQADDRQRPFAGLGELLDQTRPSKGS
jgi:uncharacterized metal-binding protein YceD (DUF177 family)